MEGKKPLVMASLLMIMLASFAVIAPTPTVSAPYQDPPRSQRYVVMGGILDSWTQMDGFGVSHSPFQTRDPYLTPNLMEQNITFGPAWDSGTYGWIVNQTIPASTFVGTSHQWFDPSPPGANLWFNLTHYLPVDGYGWVFLNDSKGDVDLCTFNNKTGVFWGSKNTTFTSPFEGQLAALPGKVPSVGPDGVAGTSDDGFGDGTKDPKGSGVMILPSRLKCGWYNTTGKKWQLLFDTDFPVILTSGTAYDIVNDTGPTYPNNIITLKLLASGYVNCVGTDIGKQVKDDNVEIGPLLAYNNTLREWRIRSSQTVVSGSAMTITGGTGAGTADGGSSIETGYASLLNGKNATLTGQPWEFLRGADPNHIGDPDYASVPYGDPMWNAYNTVACAWSMINLTTKDFGRLDIMFYLTERVVNEYWVGTVDGYVVNDYLVLPDINGDETDDIFDVVICAATFGGRDEGLWPDPPSGSGPMKVAGPPPLIFDARGDLKPEIGYIDIFDFVVIAANFGLKLTRDGIHY